ncbi:hypothetical protein BDM02DRAFT_3117523 [Thelephora ganbajun]|uniref:Uncharacterized protein n=1 Tax=Thelephora ganbajun TaxID=370292 RepID=A0ACB6ZC18_THEGA|nr:hypothetical protein BDM02DRAFT_3117523 [Thelephora ganbajun]
MAFLPPGSPWLSDSRVPGGVEVMRVGLCFYQELHHIPESFRSCALETSVSSGRVPLPVTWVRSPSEMESVLHRVQPHGRRKVRRITGPRMQRWIVLDMNYISYDISVRLRTRMSPKLIQMICGFSL